MSADHPYWRLSAFYFFFFAVVGAIIPYWNVYLDHLGFSPQEIGLLFGIMMGTRIAAPYLWGWLADRWHAHTPLVRWGCVASSLAFFAFYYDQSFVFMAVVTFIYSGVWNAVLPQFEVITQRFLGSQQHRYSYIRLWGSIGFILAVLGLGVWFQQASIATLLPIILLLLLLMTLAAFVVPRAPSLPSSQLQVPIAQVLAQPQVRAFLVVCCLLLLSHGPFYGFFSLYLQSYSYSPLWIGVLWSVGVVAEVVVFTQMPRIFARIGVRAALLHTCWLTVLRWVMTACWPESLAILFAAQLLHAASYGVFHAVGIHLVREYFPGALLGRGQALFSAVSFGLGGALGSVISGYTWERQGPEFSFILAALAALLAWWISWRWIRPQETRA